jgi:hypothetical protein
MSEDMQQFGTNQMAIRESAKIIKDHVIKTLVLDVKDDPVRVAMARSIVTNNPEEVMIWCSFKDHDFKDLKPESSSMWQPIGSQQQKESFTRIWERTMDRLSEHLQATYAKAEYTIRGGYFTSDYLLDSDLRLVREADADFGIHQLFQKYDKEPPIEMSERHASIKALKDNLLKLTVIGKPPDASSLYSFLLGLHNIGAQHAEYKDTEERMGKILCEVDDVRYQTIGADLTSGHINLANAAASVCGIEWNEAHSLPIEWGPLWPKRQKGTAGAYYKLSGSNKKDSPPLSDKKSPENTPAGEKCILPPDSGGGGSANPH